MLKTRLLMAAVLAVLTAGAALAAETPTAAPEPTAAASAQVTLPDQITGQLTPTPEFRYGMKPGPCSVAVTCLGNITISCSGQTVCYWKVDSISSRGFVECDGNRTTCSYE